MPTVLPPVRDDISGTAPNPSNAVARTAFGVLHDYLLNLLGSAGTAAAARTALETSSRFYLQARDEKANTTAAGASVAGDQTRTLNTVVSNTITGASLATNQITLPAGTYRVRAHAPAYNVASHQLRLTNITDGTVVIRGTNEYTFATVQTRSVVEGPFTLAATKVLSLTHYTNQVVATNGLGVPMSIGSVENYTTIEIWQE